MSNAKSAFKIDKLLTDALLIIHLVRQDFSHEEMPPEQKVDKRAKECGKTTNKSVMGYPQPETISA
jgi:hypothetical protein